LRKWLADAEINRDRNLRLQYLAGAQLYTNQAEAIYNELLSQRRFPRNILKGTGPFSLAVKVVLRQAKSGR
jgi:spermidine synthase